MNEKVYEKSKFLNKTKKITNHIFIIDSIRKKLISEIETFEAELENYEITMKYFAKRLEDNYTYWFFNIDEVKWGSVISLLDVGLVFKPQYVKDTEANRDKTKIISYLNKIIELNLLSRKIKGKILHRKRNLFDYEVYYWIFSKFNEKILDKCAVGESFNFGYGIGGLRPVYLRVVDDIKGELDKGFKDIKQKRLINWGKSLKNKQAIIDRGGTPFKQTRYEDGSIINNGGEFWLEYYKGSRYFYLKFQHSKVRKNLRFCKLYLCYRRRRELQLLWAESPETTYNFKKLG